MNYIDLDLNFDTCITRECKLFTGDDVNEDDDDEDSYSCHYKNKLNMALHCHQHQQQQQFSQQHFQHQSMSLIGGRSLLETNGQQNEASCLSSAINMGSRSNDISVCSRTLAAMKCDGVVGIGGAGLSPTSSSASSTSLQHQQQLTLALHHQQQQQQHAAAAFHQQAQLHSQQHQQQGHCSGIGQHQLTSHTSSTTSSSTSSSLSSSAAAAALAAAANRRDHNIDYSTLFVQLSGTLPTLYRCVSCNKIVSNRWHHANIHRPQSHECPVCGQKFTRRDNMKAHCKIKHADIKDRFFSHYVHM